MASAYWNGDAYTPSMSLRGHAQFGRTSGGVWVPMLVDAAGNPQIDIAAFTAGETQLGYVSRPAAVKTWTPSVLAAIAADNDVIAATEEITGFFRVAAGVATLDSVVLIDKDLQTQDIDIVLLDTTGSVGAEDAAFAPTDGVADTIIGVISVLIADYATSGNNSIATKRGLGLKLKAASAQTSIFAALVCRSGTPTYTASGITVKFGLEYH